MKVGLIAVKVVDTRGMPFSESCLIYPWALSTDRISANDDAVINEHLLKYGKQGTQLLQDLTKTSPNGVAKSWTYRTGIAVYN